MVLMLRERPEQAVTDVKPQVVFAFGLARPGLPIRFDHGWLRLLATDTGRGRSQRFEARFEDLF